MRSTLFTFLALSLFLAPTLRAGDTRDMAADSKSCSDDKNCAHMRWGNHHGVIEFTPKVYFLKDANSGPTFAANGFTPPSRTQMGGDFKIYGTGPHGWQVGLDFSGLMFNNESAAPSNPYTELTDNYGGLWVAKVFNVCSHVEVVAGSVLGVGITNLSTLGAQNGRLREFAFVVEPTVSVGYQVLRWFKVGAQVSYVLPFGRSIDFKGQDVGVRNISAQGFTTGVRLAFGNFGPYDDKKED